MAGPHSFVINRMAGVEDGMKIKTKALRHEVHHVPSPPGFDYEKDGAAIYPGAFHSAIPIPADADIQNRFQAWAALVTHAQLFNEFDGLRAQALAAPATMAHDMLVPNRPVS